MGSGITRPELTGPLAEHLTRLLDETMHDRRTTAVAVAEATGVDRRTVGRVRNGVAWTPDLTTVAALARWCGYRLALEAEVERPGAACVRTAITKQCSG